MIESIIRTFCSDDLHQEEMKEFYIRKEKESRSRQLQQYFMCQNNINMIVKLATQTSLSINNNNDNDEDEMKCSGSCLFIEPSCGDGRVLHQLARTYPNCSVIGNDIDESMVHISRKLLSNLDGTVTKTLVLHGDFLKTTRKTFVDNKNNNNLVEKELIVVGGPPYTLGGGTGALNSAGRGQTTDHQCVENNEDVIVDDDDGRELPLQFLVHSCNVLKAKRYKCIILIPFI